jgi:hypothetical protein
MLLGDTFFLGDLGVFGDFGTLVDRFFFMDFKIDFNTFLLFRFRLRVFKEEELIF